MDRRTAAKRLGGLSKGRALAVGAGLAGLFALGVLEPRISAQVVPGQQVGAATGRSSCSVPGDVDGDAVPDVPSGRGIWARRDRRNDSVRVLHVQGHRLRRRDAATTRPPTRPAPGSRPATRASAASRSRPGDGFITTADRRNRAQVGFPDGTMFILGFSDVTGKRADQIMQAGFLNAELPGADAAPEGRRGVLPHADQRRHGDAARPLRPALGALPRLPAGGRRSSTACPRAPSAPTWARPSPTSTS